MEISKKINLKSYEEIEENISSKESSENNILNYSIILDLMQKKMFKEFIEEIYSDIDEINENAKILNMTI